MIFVFGLNNAKFLLFDKKLHFDTKKNKIENISSKFIISSLILFRILCWQTRLRKIQDQTINGIKKYQISLVSNRSYFQKLKSVVSLKIDFLSITGFSV